MEARDSVRKRFGINMLYVNRKNKGGVIKGLGGNLSFV